MIWLVFLLCHKNSVHSVLDFIRHTSKNRLRVHRYPSPSFKTQDHPSIVLLSESWQCFCLTSKISYKIYIMWYNMSYKFTICFQFEPPHDKSNKMAGAPSEDSDQPGHPPSLIRVFAVCMKKAWILSYPLSAQRRLWPDCADAQADLSLRRAHRHFVNFVRRRLVYASLTVTLVDVSLTHREKITPSEFWCHRDLKHNLQI